jgi:predicted HTH transcriptional regulator
LGINTVEIKCQVYVFHLIDLQDFWHIVSKLQFRKGSYGDPSEGAGTQKLSRDEIRDFFRSEGAIRFDLSVCPKFRYPEDFDREKYNAWISQSRITPRGRIDDVLVNIEVAERAGRRLIFRNAGVLF